MSDVLKILGSIFTATTAFGVFFCCSFLINTGKYLYEKIENLFSDEYDKSEYSCALSKKELMNVMTNFDRLELLTNCFDEKYSDDDNQMVQKELREWAKNISKPKVDMR